MCKFLVKTKDFVFDQFDAIRLIKDKQYTYKIAPIIAYIIFFKFVF